MIVACVDECLRCCPDVVDLGTEDEMKRTALGGYSGNCGIKLQLECLSESFCTVSRHRTYFKSGSENRNRLCTHFILLYLGNKQALGSDGNSVTRSGHRK